MGVKPILLIPATLGILAVAAPGQDYFPLQPGNQWIYRSNNRDLVTAEVVRAEKFEGRDYALLRGFFGGDVYVRQTAEGSLVAYDPQTRAESLWVAFGSPDGSSFRSEIPPCQQPAQVASRAARYSGPVGDFDYALEVRFSPGTCADAGTERDLYLPWVGLVQRRVTTFAGPRTYDLVYARLGVTEVTAPEVRFSLSLDQTVYTANLMPPLDPTRSIPQMLARLTLRRIGGDPLQLTFASGQRFDLVIRNDKGEVVYQWSRGRLFTQMVGTETIAGERNWVVGVPLASGTSPLPEGRYVAEGWLTSNGARAYAASAGFEIKQVF